MYPLAKIVSLYLVVKQSSKREKLINENVGVAFFIISYY